MASTPADVPTASTRRCERGRFNPGSPPLRIHQKTPMVAVTSTLLATGAKAEAPKRRVPYSSAVATAPTA